MARSGTSGRTAMAFPGMGPTRYGDVGRLLLVDPVTRALRRRAEDVLGHSLVDALRESTDDYAEAAQVAFLVCCLGLARWAEDRLGLRPVLCAGASFGTKAAAAYTGALSFEDTVLLTTLLARCERDYFATEHRDVLTQSYARIPADRLAAVLAGLTEAGHWYELSCELDTDFAMVSVREPALELLNRGVREAGGLPLYAMYPPMHCAAFAGLRDRARDQVFGRVRFRDPDLPVVRDHDGAVVDTADGVRDLLLDGFVRAVRWPEVVRALRERLVTELCVAGPDGLFGRLACTVDAFDVVPAGPRMALQPRRRSALPA